MNAPLNEPRARELGKLAYDNYVDLGLHWSALDTASQNIWVALAMNSVKALTASDLQALQGNEEKLDGDQVAELAAKLAGSELIRDELTKRLASNASVSNAINRKLNAKVADLQQAAAGHSSVPYGAYTRLESDLEHVRKQRDAFHHDLAERENDLKFAKVECLELVERVNALAHEREPLLAELTAKLADSELIRDGLTKKIAYNASAFAELQQAARNSARESVSYGTHPGLEADLEYVREQRNLERDLKTARAMLANARKALA